MRKVEYTNQFERDYKREKKHPNNRDVDALLGKLIDVLQIDGKLTDKYRDHPLKGDYAEYRECHVKPDLLLIYGKDNPEVLRLIRLGSHSTLF